MLADLGLVDIFSGGKSCDSDSDCNVNAGVSCCGAGDGSASSRCCPTGLCKNCPSDDNIQFHYCGTYCPDYPKTTQSTPPYLSTTTTPHPHTTTTITTTTTTTIPSEHELIAKKIFIT